MFDNEVQIPNRRPHSFQRRGADRRIKPAEQPVIPAPPYQTGSKAVPEEIELDIRVCAFALSVFAVDDLGLSRMQLQTTRCQADLKLNLQSLCLLLASAVHQSIIGIPTPREVGVGPRHPEIERVVQKGVR